MRKTARELMSVRKKRGKSEGTARGESEGKAREK
jgi:hypothetical protein